MTNHDDETRRKEIIEMARESGFTDWWINPPEPERKGMCYGMLARLVEIAQAREREACAKACEEVRDDCWSGSKEYESAARCAEAIRIRSNQ